MATSNHDRVGRALHLLKVGLGPFVDRVVKDQRVSPATLQKFVDARQIDRPVTRWDVPALINLMLRMWNDVFCKALRLERYSLRELRSHLHELLDHRNRWAHQEPFSNDDAYRAIDTAHRLLTAVSAEQAGAAERLKTELLRARFEEGCLPPRGVRAGGASPAGRAATSTNEQWRQALEAARSHRRLMEFTSSHGPEPEPPPGSAREATGPRRAAQSGSIIRSGNGGVGSRHEAAPHGGPRYPCPIPGCTKVFHGTRGGWDAHVASWRMHRHWHPDVINAPGVPAGVLAPIRLGHRRMPPHRRGRFVSESPSCVRDADGPSS